MGLVFDDWWLGEGGASGAMWVTDSFGCYDGVLFLGDFAGFGVLVGLLWGICCFRVFTALIMYCAWFWFGSSDWSICFCFLSHLRL